jgi:hypothetical protein
MVLEALIKLIVAILVLVFAFGIVYGLWRLVEIPLRRWRESAFDYVYIDDTGAAHELSPEEEEFVTSAIFPDEDADQYLKSHYNSLTTDGRVSGYLKRRQLPQQISVGSPRGDAIIEF